MKWPMPAFVVLCFLQHNREIAGKTLATKFYHYKNLPFQNIMNTQNKLHIEAREAMNCIGVVMACSLAARAYWVRY